MLKNWLVKTKQIKNKSNGFVNSVNYLKDKNRSAHSYTDISVLNDSSKRILDEYDKRTLFRRKNGLRGGGVNNYATSFVLSLPRDIKQPTKDQWKKISLDVISAIAETNGIDKKKLKDLSHVVLHDESQSPDKHTHVHMLVSNVVDNQVVKGISQFKTTHAIKQQFNKSVYKHLGVDNYKYMPKNEGKPDKPLWVARAEKLKAIDNAFKDLKQNIGSWLDNLKNWRNKAIFSSKKVAKSLDKLEEEIPKGNVIEKVFEEVEKIEEETPNTPDVEIVGEVSELPKGLEEKEKATPKTNRKRRRRSSSNKLKNTIKK